MITRSTDIKAALRSRQRGFLLNPFRFGAGGGGGEDPHWSNVTALLHGDGENDSTTIADSSSIGAALTAHGNAKISTARKKFGSSSIFFDGGTSFLTAPSSAGYFFGANDFTMEWWVNFRSIKWSCFFQQSNGTSGYILKWSVYFRDYEVRVNGHNPSATSYSIKVANWSPSADVFYHCALVQSGGYLLFFVDGVLLGSVSTGGFVFPNSSGELYIGRFRDTPTGGPDNFDGYLDDIRFTKGIARHTVNFTPPSSPFPNS